MNTQISLKIRPNNQLTLTIGKWRKKELDISQNPQRDFDKIPYSEKRELANDIQARRDVYQKIRNPLNSKRRAKLDIIKKSQRSKKPFVLVRQKPKSFTRFSGQKIRESGAAMAIACQGKHSRCREVTLTLPANHHDAFDVLAKASGYAINRLLEPVRKEFGKDALWFFVWEYQKRGALHLHFAIYHECEKQCAAMAQMMIRQWHKILCDLSQKTGICMFSRRDGKSCTIRKNHQYHTAPMEKEVSRYFSKYAGKEESKNNWYCQKYPVSRFWGSSRSIKEIIKKNSFEFQWDYFSNQEEADKMVQEIVESLIEKLAVISVSSYDFAIWLKGKSRINKYQNERKILSLDAAKCIVSGTKICIYIDNGELPRALDISDSLSHQF